MEQNAIEAKQQLNKIYLDYASSIQIIERRFADFKRGRTNTNEAKHSGYPNSSGFAKHIQKFKKMVWKTTK